LNTPSDNPEIQFSASTGTRIQVPQAALKVLLGGILSLALGLGCQMAIATLFGSGSEVDAYFTALIVPLYLQLVLLGGLTFVIVPLFVQEQTQDHEENSWSLAGTVFWLALFVLAGVALLGSIGAPTIIQLLAPGFAPEKSDLAAQMLVVLIFTLPFVGISYLTSSIQNVQNFWFWPAAAAAVGSAANLALLLFFHASLGSMSLAWGSLVSAILMASITVVPFLNQYWKKTRKQVRVMPLKDPRMIEMGRLYAPFIFFGIFTCSKMLFERFFGSSLPDGQIAYLGYATKISNIFVVLLASSIASAIFPAMARSFSTTGMDALKSQMNFGFKLTLVVALPIVALVSILAVPLVMTLYEHGSFDHLATLSVAILIPVVMVNEVLFRMLSNIIIRFFYIMKDTFLVNLLQSLTILIYILAAVFLTQHWGYFGLALAQPIQTAVFLIILGILLFRRIRPMPIVHPIRKTMGYLIFSLAAALVGWLVLQLCKPFPIVIQLTGGLLGGVLVYLALLGKYDRPMITTLLEAMGLKKIQTFVKVMKQRPL
jgi:putative peptidoglycan lipid II flippase